MNRRDVARVCVCGSLAGRTTALIMGSVIWMAASSHAWGQWSTGSGGTIYYNGGNVGIGTAAPTQRLDVNGNLLIEGGNSLIFGSGFGNGALLSTYPGYLNLRTGATGFNIDNNAGTLNLIAIQNGGNVGIGTMNPQYLLSVNGTIGAKDVIVTNTGWPDYVFRPGYRLRSLTEVSAYIQANHHLPDIPTETEVKEKGVSMADMQARLLAKIEELTLHLIQQEKENMGLQERLGRLENRLAASSASGR